MQESFWWWQCSDRYMISLFPNLHTPFSPSLISLMVSVDVKHHVYLLKKRLKGHVPEHVYNTLGYIWPTDWTEIEVALSNGLISLLDW